MSHVGLISDVDLLESTVAARLNSLVNGISSKEKSIFEKEIEDGMPELEGRAKERDYLIQYIKTYDSGGKRKMYCG